MSDPDTMPFNSTKNAVRTPRFDFLTPADYIYVVELVNRGRPAPLCQLVAQGGSIAAEAPRGAES